MWVLVPQYCRTQGQHRIPYHCVLSVYLVTRVGGVLDYEHQALARKVGERCELEGFSPFGK